MQGVCEVTNHYKGREDKQDAILNKSDLYPTWMTQTIDKQVI